MQETSRPLLFDDLTRCRAWIEAALEHTNGTHNFDDVAAGIYAGRFHLVAGKTGCIVLEVQDYPQKRVLHVFLAAGRLEEMKERIAELDAMAAQVGAQEISMTGRPGWARILAPLGWDREHISLRKKANE